MLAAVRLLRPVHLRHLANNINQSLRPRAELATGEHNCLFVRLTVKCALCPRHARRWVVRCPWGVRGGAVVCAGALCRALCCPCCACEWMVVRGWRCRAVCAARAVCMVVRGWWCVHSVLCRLCVLPVVCAWWCEAGGVRSVLCAALCVLPVGCVKPGGGRFEYRLVFWHTSLV